jgi:hypothetical protein
LALLLALALPPATFYGCFEYRSRAIADRHTLDAGYANALKHAEAAATLYSALRFVGLSSGTSERAVLRLGMINEFVEIYVKRGRKDTTLEMTRDLHNNMTGIAVTQWRDSGKADRRSRSEQLVALARAGVLLRSEDDVILPPDDALRAKQTADLDWVIAWFKQNKTTIEKRTMHVLLEPRS